MVLADPQCINPDAELFSDTVAQGQSGSLFRSDLNMDFALPHTDLLPVARSRANSTITPSATGRQVELIAVLTGRGEFEPETAVGYKARIADEKLTAFVTVKIDPGTFGLRFIHKTAFDNRPHLGRNAQMGQNAE